MSSRAFAKAHDHIDCGCAFVSCRSFRYVSIYVCAISFFIWIALLRLPRWPLFYRLSCLVSRVSCLGWFALVLISPRFFLFFFSSFLIFSFWSPFILLASPGAVSTALDDFLFPLFIFCFTRRPRSRALPSFLGWHFSLFFSISFCLIFYISAKRLLLFGILYALMGTPHRIESGTLRCVHAGEWPLRATSRSKTVFCIDEFTRLNWRTNEWRPKGARIIAI